MSLFQWDDTDKQEQNYMFLGDEKIIEKDISAIDPKRVYCPSSASM